MQALRLGAFMLFAFTMVAQREYPSPPVREEQTVVIDGVKETWRLVWVSAPKPECEPSDASFIGPCEGFAFGEGGELDLVRERNGREVERLHLTHLFHGRIAIVQRWRPDEPNDFALAHGDEFPEIVARRPVVQIMHFSDYNHDGQSSEFYLQTESAPFGKSVGIVIGVSKTNSQLHVFGTASKPNEPLYLQKREWESLRDASGPIEVVDWPCGDHGSEKEISLQLRWTPQGIDGKRRDFTCPGGLKTAN